MVDPLEEEFNAKLANKKQRYNIFRNGDADKRTKADCVVIDDTCPRENEIKLVSPLPPPLVCCFNGHFTLFRTLHFYDLQSTLQRKLFKVETFLLMNNKFQIYCIYLNVCIGFLLLKCISCFLRLIQLTWLLVS